jgi:ABC-type amino acid transport system permease subunit
MVWFFRNIVVVACLLPAVFICEWLDVARYGFPVYSLWLLFAYGAYRFSESIRSSLDSEWGG